MKNAPYAVALGLSLMLSGRAPAQTNPTKVFLLAVNNQWCSYSEESARDAELHTATDGIPGTLTYTGDRLSQIDIRWLDGQDGEFAISDSYMLDNRGRITKLMRHVDILMDYPNAHNSQRTVIQTYRIGGGMADLISAAQTQLHSNKPISEAEPGTDWFPQVGIWGDTKSLPMGPLLAMPNLRSSSNLCAAAVPARGVSFVSHSKLSPQIIPQVGR
jgi:hypothetical protein